MATLHTLTVMSQQANRAHEEHERQCVTWAMGVLNRAGVEVWYDAEYRMWDVETKSGWRTAQSGFELARIAREVSP